MQETYLPDGYTLTPTLSEERQTHFTQPTKVLEPDKSYLAVIETSKGRMLVDLFQDEAPKTVNNFVFLAQHHFYDGVTFHRVLENFIAQTGDPTGSGSGGPGYEFDDEFSPQLRHDSKGIVSMANAGPNTNGSQLFITFRPTPHLDERHAIFGRVIEGIEVLDNLQRVNPMRSGDAEPDVMERVYIVEKDISR